MKNIEIERKFLLNSLEGEVVKDYEIEQAYVCIDGKSETRIRKRVEGNEAHFFLTVKAGEGMVRTEVEVEITKAQYDELRLTSSRVVTKRRVVTREGFEVDLYRGNLENLRVVEVEFSSREEADSFAIPSWFGREVTEDKRFKNRALAISQVIPE